MQTKLEIYNQKLKKFRPLDTKKLYCVGPLSKAVIINTQNKRRCKYGQDKTDKSSRNEGNITI